MRAIVHDPAGLRLADVPDPEPAPHELRLERRIVGRAVMEIGS